MGLFFQNISFSGNFNTDSSGPPPIRCIVATSAETVNEGGSISFVIYTQNVPTGATTLYWAVEPSGATNVDFAANTVPTGTISVSSNFGTASGIVIRSDLLTEPAVAIRSSVILQIILSASLARTLTMKGDAEI